jgi:hypothetical protein
MPSDQEAAVVDLEAAVGPRLQHQTPWNAFCRPTLLQNALDGLCSVTERQDCSRRPWKRSQTGFA